MNLKDLTIDISWTLFLDRDGVINKRIVDDYVKKWDEFEFVEGVIDAVKKFKTVFGTIIVVTNQQGIGKGIMRPEDLELIHKNMIYELTYFGGKIDKVYYSPFLASENHSTRKPAIGMALQAKKDFPQIDFNRSIMVGDSGSDIAFGKNAGMKTVFIGAHNNYKADLYCSSLVDFSKLLA